MPNAEQFQLYSMLAHDFNSEPVWKMYAEDISFAEMGPHEAAHFLGFMMMHLVDITIGKWCRCGRPFQVMLEPKNPAARPGSSDGPAQ
jgi:hypothetical protein